MEKFEPRTLDDRFVDRRDPSAVAAFDLETFTLNRADGIRFLERRFGADQESHAWLSRRRKTLRDVTTRELRDPAMLKLLSDDADLNHFLVLLGQLTDRMHSGHVHRMADFIVDEIRQAFRVDLAAVRR